MIMDGSLGRDLGAFDTEELVVALRSTGYIGPIIANSGGYNEELLRCGCDESSGRFKMSRKELAARAALLR